MQTLNDLCPLISGKTVIVRADLNVPMKNGHITDTNRIEKSLPTLKALLNSDARVILISHLGRPKGQPSSLLSLSKIADKISDFLEQPVEFSTDCIGKNALEKANALEDGQILLLENLRFHAQEEENNIEFAKELASFADFYVNDAFSTAHRAHASTEALAHLIPAYAGLLMESEINALRSALDTPEKPVAAIVGGAKISTKLDILNNLVKKTDTLILGGAMANTFLYAQGLSIGKSLCEADMADTARSIMKTAEQHNCTLLLPEDCVIAAALSPNVATSVTSIDNIPDDQMVLDIGPKTIETLCQHLKSCKTILWNGPMGAFEIPPFNLGTNAVARFVAEQTKQGQMSSIAGGGDTAFALSQANVSNDFSYISTAGGAFLEWIEGKELPGIKALTS